MTEDMKKQLKKWLKYREIGYDGIGDAINLIFATWGYNPCEVIGELLAIQDEMMVPRFRLNLSKEERFAKLLKEKRQWEEE